MSKTADPASTGKADSDKTTPATPKDASVSKVVEDVKAMGKDIKANTKEAGTAIVESAREIASDSRELARQTYEQTRERVRSSASRLESSARDRIAAEPIKAVLCALGIGFFLGRFVINGR